VLLTTNDEAMNIYLAVYCRKLNPDLRIVSRITHERNVEAIHRAGADFVLSYTSLGVDSIMSLVNGDATVMLGEGVRLFEVRVPSFLAGQPLSKTGIGSRTGLSVVAIEEKGDSHDTADGGDPASRRRHAADARECRSARAIRRGVRAGEPLRRRTHRPQRSRSSARRRTTRSGRTALEAGTPAPVLSTQMPVMPSFWGCSTSHSRLSPIIQVRRGGAASPVSAIW
jgi:hypothetical protein